MRSRAVRLGRSLRSIALSVMASPLAVAGAVACSESAGEGPLDATIREGAAASVSDANGPDRDGGGAVDATVDSTGPTDASGTGSAMDREGCGSTPIDGTIENTQDGCVAFGQLPCGLPPTAMREGCLVDLATCIPLCDGIDASFFLYCQLAPVSCDEAGTLLDAQSVIECLSCNGITGRRPLGLCASRVPKRTPLGDYFAQMAHLEAASVRAFSDLARWLGALDAPARLSRAARRFADDERRHARAAARLARRFGGVTSRPRVRRAPAPTLVELLEDDAVEGCVKETFGALLAIWQAERASDARVRRTLRRIAADETRHAALAWEILGWGVDRLPPRDRRRVEKTLERAALALKSGEFGAVHPAVRQIAGHPDREHERLLAREFARLVGQERRGLLAGHSRPLASRVIRQHGSPRPASSRVNSSAETVVVTRERPWTAVPFR